MNNGVKCGSRIFFKWPWSAAICGDCKNKPKTKPKKEFYCNSCHYTYKEELFAVENAKDGKVCRFCWDKKLKKSNNEEDK